MPTRNSSGSQSLQSDLGSPNFSGSERAVAAQKIRGMGLEPLASGLEKAGRTQLALLGVNPDSVVKTPWGKGVARESVVAFAGDTPTRAAYEKRASDLADQLNEMVKQGRGDSAFFKALDAEYQRVKTVRDDPTTRGVSKTLENNGGMVSDITGTSFNIKSLLRNIAGDAGTKVFKGFKEGNDAKGVYGLAQDIRERAILADTSGWKGVQTTKVFYVPAVYNKMGYGGTDEMRLTEWKKVEVIKGPQGEFPTIGKISSVKKKDEVEKAVFGYVNRSSF